MKLPPGITGFSVEDETFQKSDLKKFRSICYDVSMQEQVVLLSIDEVEYPANFTCAKFSLNNEPIQIVLNAFYPIFTATVISENGHLVFATLPNEFDVFKETYQFIDEELLMKPVTEEVTENLSEVEKQTIELWSPQNIGEVVFNVWD